MSRPIRGCARAEVLASAVREIDDDTARPRSQRIEAKCALGEHVLECEQCAQFCFGMSVAQVREMFAQ